MPLHRIFHPPGLYTPAEKANLSARITALYSSSNSLANLPDFFVVVLFIEVPADSMYVAGRPRNNFVRIVVEHIARNMGGSVEKMEYFMKRYEEAIADATKNKSGVDNWEVHIAETPLELWRIDGIRPPMRQGEEDRLEVWHKEGKAIL